MVYDVKAKVYKVKTGKDGFGGETETLEYLKTIDCAFTAFGETEQSKKYGKSDNQYFKILTLDELPDQDVAIRFKIGSKLYDPYSDRRFGLHGRQSIMVKKVS